MAPRQVGVVPGGVKLLACYASRSDGAHHRHCSPAGRRQLPGTTDPRSSESSFWPLADELAGEILKAIGYSDCDLWLHSNQWQHVDTALFIKG